MTKTTFTTATETFTKNVNDTFKWLQETTATVLENQSKQFKSASELYTKAFQSSLENVTANNYTTTAWFSEVVTELVQKNIEFITNYSKSTLTTVWDFTKQTGADNYSTETVAKVIDTYKKQIEEISSFNKKTFETLNKQFADTTAYTTVWTPWVEKFQKEFEASVETSKSKVKDIVDNYSKIATPSFEVNKELFNKLNQQVTTSVNENLKQWNEFTKSYTEKFKDVKNPTDFFKTTTPATTTTTKKKQVEVINN